MYTDCFTLVEFMFKRDAAIHRKVTAILLRICVLCTVFPSPVKFGETELVSNSV